MAEEREGGAAVAAPPEPRKKRGRFGTAIVFLLPALILLGALVIYPIFFTVYRSLFDRAGDAFVAAGNYVNMFNSGATLTAIRNNLIWVVFAPSIVTALGLVFAVLTERVKWATAFKVAIFMPMAISFLAAGVIFRLVYEDDPDRGVANAVVTAVVDVVRSPGPYPGARPSLEGDLRGQGDAFVTSDTFVPGETANVALVAISQDLVPEQAQRPDPPDASPRVLHGVVWLDFTPGGGGEKGTIDPTEVGLPEIIVEALDGEEVAATSVTAADGSFAFEGLDPTTSYRIRMTEDNFRPPFGGISWLGPTLVTPSVIGSYVWIWAGFAMVVIGAGLAAIPRDVLEAARVDGASEWQVFRRVTVPLLMPVLLVVLVTLVINVLKIFDLVLIIPPGSVQADANVIALEMWRVSFGGAQDQGLGSALAVFLFVLVVPAMLFNIRRFKAEQD